MVRWCWDNGLTKKKGGRGGGRGEGNAGAQNLNGVHLTSLCQLENDGADFRGCRDVGLLERLDTAISVADFPLLWANAVFLRRGERRRERSVWD